jgi:hypothetical protein
MKRWQPSYTIFLDYFTIAHFDPMAGLWFYSFPLFLTKKVNFIVQYFREYEAICKKVLTRASGGSDGVV